MSTINELINEINSSGEYKIDKFSKIIYQKINLGWFMYCKYWTKKDLERFIQNKLRSVQHTSLVLVSPNEGMCVNLHYRDSFDVVHYSNYRITQR